jgi:hypothetical protein
MVALGIRPFMPALMLAFALIRAEGAAFEACRDFKEPPVVRLPHKGNPIPDRLKPRVREEQAAFGRVLGLTLENYLRESEADIRDLIAWLNPFGEMKDLPRCAADDGPCILFRKVLPDRLKELRIRLALSLSADPLNHFIWRLDQGGNPTLQRPLFSPSLPRMEPLIEGERALAQSDLLRFFDGANGVIGQYMSELRRRIGKQQGLPELALNFPGADRPDRRAGELLERFAATRKFASAEERIERAFAVSEQDWVVFRNKRLREMQKSNQIRIWEIVDEIRPLLYLAKARPSLTEVRDAFTRALTDNLDFQNRIRTTYLHLADPDYDAGREIEWMMDYPLFVELALAENPQTCGAALKIQRRMELKETAVTALIFTAASVPLGLNALGLAAGLRLSLITPPIRAALGPLAAMTGTLSKINYAMSLGTTGWLTYKQYSHYRALHERYVSAWSPVDPVPFGIGRKEIVREEKEMFAASTSLILVGIPFARIGVLRNLVRFLPL